MTLIKCPSCGHTVLSLASKCPSCGFHLTQPRFQQGFQGSLTECRKCGLKVLSGTRQCPYCGVQHPGRTGRVGTVLGLVGLTAGLGFLLLVAQQLQPAAPQVPEVEVIAAPSVGSADAGRPDTAAQANSAPPSMQQAGGESRPEGALVRWLSNWANLREGRSLDSRVVGVLRPGQQVAVANRVAGWWEVYLDGRFAGYVAGSLLLTQLPDSLRPQ